MKPKFCNSIRSTAQWVTYRMALLLAALYLSAVSHAAEQQASGSKYTPPAKSERAADADTHNKANDLVPVLSYNDPPEFYRGAGRSPIEYSSREVNCSMQVYPFRPCQGDIAATFQRTMLRDWIDPRYREERLAGSPEFSTSRLAGAETVVMARFHDSPVGLPNERLRILVTSAGHAAIVDVMANSTYSWQKAWPAVKAMLASMRVEKKTAPPSFDGGPGAAGSALAGLYRGNKSKYIVDLSGPVGSGHHVRALHYYLFSSDGWVHCCYDFPPVSNGNWRQFDFKQAQRQDPVNTGRYTVRDKQLFIRMSAPSSEIIVASLGNPDQLEIETVTYTRQK
jgi:hypothetical protein